MNLEEKVRLASHTRTEVLSNNKDPYVRSAVARNSKTPASVLKKLSEDEDWYVRYCVAQNLNTANIILEKLSRDEVEIIRKSAAQNSSNYRVREIMKVGRESALKARLLDIYNLNVEFLKFWENGLFEIIGRGL